MRVRAARLSTIRRVTVRAPPAPRTRAAITTATRPRRCSVRLSVRTARGVSRRRIRRSAARARQPARGAERSGTRAGAAASRPGRAPAARSRIRARNAIRHGRSQLPYIEIPRVASTRWCGMRSCSRGAAAHGQRRLRRRGRRRAGRRGGGRRRASAVAVGVGVAGRRPDGLGRPRPVDRHRRALDGVVAAARARVGQGEGEPVAAALAGLHDAEVERVGAGERAGPRAAADLLHAQQQRVGEPPAEAAGRVDHAACAAASGGRATRRRWRARRCRRPTGRGAGPRRVMIACEEPVAGERHRALGRHAARARRAARARARPSPRARRRAPAARPAASARAARHGPAPLPSQTLTGTAKVRKLPL